jgi:hypothetical protein
VLDTNREDRHGTFRFQLYIISVGHGLLHNIVENAKLANSQLPSGQVVRTERLPVPSRHVCLVLQLLIHGIHDATLIPGWQPAQMLDRGRHVLDPERHDSYSLVQGVTIL